jgi:hypothetical protein
MENPRFLAGNPLFTVLQLRKKKKTQPFSKKK